jgi:hypothetical protein
MRSTVVATLALAALIGAGAASAHHSRAQFQLEETVVMKAKITRVRWSNPHVFFAGNVVNDEGRSEEWIFEGHSIAGLSRLGWTRDTLRPGDEVQVVVNRSRDRSKLFALLDSVILADGRKLYSVGVPPPNAVAQRPPVEPSKDFTGNWRFRFPGTPEEIRKRVLLGPQGPKLDGPYTPRTKAQLAKFDFNDNPALTCEPISIPSVLMTVYEYKWTRYPDRIVIQKEQYADATRTIWLTKKERPKSYKPNPMGFSVGHFEPDGTLVVETTGFNALKWGNGQGIDSSEQKRIVERYELIDGGMGISLSYTQDDPVYFTQTMTGQGTFVKAPTVEFAKQPACDLEAAREHLKF